MRRSALSAAIALSVSVAAVVAAVAAAVAADAGRHGRHSRAGLRQAPLRAVNSFTILYPARFTRSFSVVLSS